MTAAAGTTLKGGVPRGASGLVQRLAAAWWSVRNLPAALTGAFEAEAEHRRYFLWMPAAVGTGVVLYFVADREPSLPLVAGLTVALAALAFAARRHALAFRTLVAAAAVAVSA